jgi:SPP1 gp7 family putative phage head morphogenesis protein
MTVATLNARRSSSWNPDRSDPTRTGPLRREFLRELRRRFRRIKTELVELVRVEDAFGLAANAAGRIALANAGRGIRNAGRWSFLSTADALKQFQTWLARRLRSELIGRSEDDLWRKFSEEAWRQGAGRSWTDVRQSQLRKERPELFLPERQESLRDFYEGSREEFLRSAFNRPVAVEKLKLLASRTFEDLKGVTEQMAARIRRTLTDGMARGEHSVEIARALAEDVDIGLGRAEAISRTEISRAYTEGQLDALEEMGVDALGVMVEWSTAGDSAVCPLCRPLEGVVLSIEEARGLLPRHPNCRCAYVPANVGEDKRGQKRGARADAALGRSGL